MIKILELSEDYKYKRLVDPETKKESYERLDEKELLLTRYKILKKSKKSVDEN